MIRGPGVVNSLAISVLVVFCLTCNTDGQIATEYYVSTDGNNDNPGTETLPFKTIGRACYELTRYGGRFRPWPTGGITVWIRDGIYRETVRPLRSGTADAPVRFVAHPGESPIVSGADLLDVSWAVHSGNIYEASTTAKFVQLFVDGQMMNEARWPNTPVDDLVHMKRATCKWGTNANMLIDSTLPEGDWNGAYVHIIPGNGWFSSTKQIKDYQPHIGFYFADSMWVDTGQVPKPFNPYWLFGALSGLDIATEWFLDSTADVIYLWCPGSPDPNAHRIEVRRRLYAFDLSNLSYIHIEGLSIFAAGINMKGSAYCTVDDCHVKYPEHYGARYVNDMGGHHNEWKNSSIAYSAGYAICDKGSYNKVTNCIIHDVDYLADDLGAIDSQAYGSEYTYNTLYNSGRFIIYLHHAPDAKTLRIEHNHMYNAGLLTKNCGIICAQGRTDGAETVIAYNHVHDSWPNYGIGLDSGADNYSVHHNLVWNCAGSGIRLTAPSVNNRVQNNTILESAGGISWWNDPPTAPNLTMPGTEVINNLTQSGLNFPEGELVPEAHHNGSFPVDAYGWPTPYSGAIDAGVVIPGITDGYVGSAPDIGCFEVGTEGWTAGADWVEP